MAACENIPAYQITFSERMIKREKKIGQNEEYNAGERNNIHITILKTNFFVKTEDGLWPVLYYYSQIGYQDIIRVKEHFGLSKFRGTHLSLLSILNMIPFTGWNAEKAEKYISESVDELDMYPGLLMHVLGLCDPSYNEKELSAIKWLDDKDDNYIIFFYIAFVIAANTNVRFRYVNYRPGHIKYQLLEEIVNTNDFLVKYLDRAITDEKNFDNFYSDLGLRRFGLNKDKLLMFLFMLKPNSDYIRSLTIRKEPRVSPLEANHFVFIVCFAQENLVLNDTSIGISKETLYVMKKIGILLEDTSFDLITYTKIIIDNNTFEIAQEFPSEESLELFEDINILKICKTVAKSLISQQCACISWLIV